MSTTRIHQSNSQEFDIRPSKSAAGYVTELHKVTLDGSGDGTIQTKLDKIIGMVAGGSGSTAVADVPVIDLTSKTETADFASTGIYTYAIKGTASAVLFLFVWGYYVGE